MLQNGSRLVAVPALVLLLMILTPLLSGRAIPASLSPALLGTLGLVGFAWALYLFIRWLVRRKADTDTDAKSIFLGVLLGLTAPVIVAMLFVFPRAPVPERFNDISTDLQNPPQIMVGPNADAVYPPQFIAWQMDGYPDIQPITVQGTREQVYAQVMALVEVSGWEVVYRESDVGVMQAVARTPLFRFEDDVVIRLLDSAHGTRLDMRSKSRFGRGDRGANAARIDMFLNQLQAEVKDQTVGD